MSPILVNLINSLGPVLGQKAVTLIQEELVDLSLSTAGWKKTVLELLADAVKKHGMTGVQMALDAVKDIVDGKPVKISWADLKVASDLLAELQNAEADEKSAAHDFLIKVSHIFSVILAGLIAEI